MKEKPSYEYGKQGNEKILFSQDEVIEWLKQARKKHNQEIN